MPLYTTDALILRTYALGETDRIVVFLTRDRGKKRGVAKSAKRSRRRFGGALEPMTSGRVGYVERERRELVQLSYVEPLRSPMTAARGESLVYIEYFADLIDQWAPEADPNEALFRLGVSVVEAMASGVAPDLLARYFEHWLLRLQGIYQPDPGASDEARAFLATARRSSPMELSGVQLPSRQALRELEATHRVAIARHLEKDLKSARVLREAIR